MYPSAPFFVFFSTLPAPSEGQQRTKRCIKVHFCTVAPQSCQVMRAFRYQVTVLWRRALRRRSQKAGLTRERTAPIAA